MDRETRKPGTGSKNLAERGKTNVQASGAPHLADDEFHEFFSKGDIGDYEGGVARSEPPSKLSSEAHPEEPMPRHATPEQVARRAFFARVVGGVVAGCVMLLVVATQFRGSHLTEPVMPAERVMAARAVPAQPESLKPAELPAAQAMPSIAPKPAAAPEVNDVPSEGLPKVTPPAEVTPPRLALVQPKATDSAITVAKAAEPIAQVANALPKATERAAPSASKRTSKVATRAAAKASNVGTSELQAPVAAPVAPKQSFASFPVE